MVLSLAHCRKRDTALQSCSSMYLIFDMDHQLKCTSLTAVCAGLQMVRCEEYRGAAGTGAQGAQPFSVSVTPAALLAMDFHAHLCSHEVIGMLGGTFDAATRSMRWVGSIECGVSGQLTSGRRSQQRHDLAEVIQHGWQGLIASTVAFSRAAARSQAAVQVHVPVSELYAAELNRRLQSPPHC